LYPIIPTSPLHLRESVFKSQQGSNHAAPKLPFVREILSPYADYQSRPFVPSLGQGEMFDLNKGYRRTCFSPQLHKKKAHQLYYNKAARKLPASLKPSISSRMLRVKAPRS
jgi:hypothetical protein